MKNEKPLKKANRKDLKRTKRIVAVSNLRFLLFLGFRSDLNRPLEKKLSSVAIGHHATFGKYIWFVDKHIQCNGN